MSLVIQIPCRCSQFGLTQDILISKIVFKNLTNARKGQKHTFTVNFVIKAQAIDRSFVLFLLIFSFSSETSCNVFFKLFIFSTMEVNTTFQIVDDSKAMTLIYKKCKVIH